MLFVVTPSMGSNRKLNVLQHLNIVAVLPLSDMCQCVHIEKFSGFSIRFVCGNTVDKKTSAHTNMRTLVQNLLLL